MTDKENPHRQQQAKKIINKHATYSLIGGAIPIPLIDIVAVTSIQLDMLQKLAELYEINFNSDRGKILVSALLSSTLGISIGRVGASAAKAIPGIGTILGISSQVIFSGATTYAIGHVFWIHFEQKGTLFDFDVSNAKQQFVELIQKGKEFCIKKEHTTTNDDILATISKLKSLKDSEIINEEEFEKTKKKLLEKLIR